MHLGSQDRSFKLLLATALSAAAGQAQQYACSAQGQQRTLAVFQAATTSKHHQAHNQKFELHAWYSCSSSQLCCHASNTNRFSMPAEPYTVAWAIWPHAWGVSLAAPKGINQVHCQCIWYGAP